MEAPIQQTPGVESQTAEAVPQVAEETQVQETPVNQVEATQSTSQGQGGSPDYETARQIKNLMKEIRSLKQSFETRPSVQAPPQPQQQYQQPTREELIADPLKAIQRMIEAQTGQVKQELPQLLQQKEAEWKAEQARQEGLRLIKTNELVRKDPQGQERMDAIILETDEDGNSLQEYSKFNPKHAAQLALERYQMRYGQSRSPNPPSKAQMMTTATATNAGGGRSTTEAQIGAIYAQIAQNPDLMKDPQFMAKMSELTKLHDREAMSK